MIKKIALYSITIFLLGCASDDEKVEKKSETPIVEIERETEVIGISYETNEPISTNLTQTQKDVENEHNKKRRNHFLDSDISYSIKLEREAQRYANILANNGRFEHDPQNHKNGFGENLYANSQNQVLTIFNAITPWYDDEKPYYHYDDGSCDEGRFSNGQDIMCGHYTQIIWQNSKEVGCASAQYKVGNFKGGYVYVCKYQKAGNIVGLKPFCTEYNTDDLYTKTVPSFKRISLSNKTFAIELVVEDRKNCTRKDNHNSAISFGANLKSVIIKDFQIFNNGEYPNTLEFNAITIGDRELKLTGVNKNNPKKSLRDAKIYMNIKLIGETKEYYAVELDWNGYDINRPTFSRQMKAKLY
ncbi:MAG: hypothetical protein KAG56_03460, partial [Sulfurovaceae bacterium]|nr:hypothetical protein [Sulfurovaceae bacterium]